MFPDGAHPPMATDGRFTCHLRIGMTTPPRPSNGLGETLIKVFPTEWRVAGLLRTLEGTRNHFSILTSETSAKQSLTLSLIFKNSDKSINLDGACKCKC